MDVEQFRTRGKEMVDYICTYMTTIRTRRVSPAVKPGYLQSLMPLDPPQQPGSWDDVILDLEKNIMPGVLHWTHPDFHAYFPAGNAYPTIIADMLSSVIAGVGFSWASLPACTELEIIMMEWMGKAIGLPLAFLPLEEGGKGGGVIQGSASDCVVVSMIAARANAIQRLVDQDPSANEGLLLSKLMAYTSTEAHSSVQKAAMICFVKLRVLEADEKGSLRGDTLKKAMDDDVAAGYVPFFVSTTLGTTGICAFDNLQEIGPVVQQFPAVWLHTDAAYAGSTFICPEYRHFMKGLEYANSFNFNPNKFMFTAFDCSLLWVTDRYLLTSALAVDPFYLQHSPDNKIIDYRHWTVALSRRFRSFKLWFLLQSYGISGIQNDIRSLCRLAKYFEQLLIKDKRFTLENEVKMGLVCFRLNGREGQTDEEVDILNSKLLTNINASGKLVLTPTMFRGRFVIRYCVTYPQSTEADMDLAWTVIKEYASKLLPGSSKDRYFNWERAREQREVDAQTSSVFVQHMSDPNFYSSNVYRLPMSDISDTTKSSGIIKPLRVYNEIAKNKHRV